MSSQSVQAMQINTELQGCAKHWVWGFWQEGVYNHQHLLICYQFSLPQLSTRLWSFFWTYLSSTFTCQPSRYLALFHSIMQSTILCSKEIIFSFLTPMHFSLLCSCWWWSISFSPTCFLCNEQKLCKNGSTNQPGAVYVKTTAIWNKSPFPGTLWVLSVHWWKNMSHNLRNSESAANIT